MVKVKSAPRPNFKTFRRFAKILELTNSHLPVIINITLEG